MHTQAHIGARGSSRLGQLRDSQVKRENNDFGKASHGAFHRIVKWPLRIKKISRFRLPIHGHMVVYVEAEMRVSQETPEHMPDRHIEFV